MCRVIGRRVLLAGALGATSAYLATRRGLISTRTGDSPVFVARNCRYDGALTATIREALASVGLDGRQFRKKRVLLKPNLVEPSRDHPEITTHPSVVVAVADVLRGWGAEVVVGEGPGHVRDTDLVLDESGLGDALHDAGLEFVDLNRDEVRRVENRGGRSAIESFHFPRSAADADLIVSIPKLKTHHWIGMTASMKNLYGVVPGSVYGWPKNVLHFAGIPQTVFDINASLPRTIAVVDAIHCMEGDGPIMGTLKHMGLIVVGANTTAVDATCARLIGVDPQSLEYLRLADRRLGPVDDRTIPQRGEPLAEVASRFEFKVGPR